MSVYSDALNQLVDLCESVIGVPATRDPAVVIGLVAGGGCVFVGMPSHVDQLMAGPNLTVPISLVAPAPSDLRAVNWLLDHLDGLLKVAGGKQVRNGPIDIGSTSFPAVTATAQMAVTSPAEGRRSTA